MKTPQFPILKEADQHQHDVSPLSINDDDAVMNFVDIENGVNINGLHRQATNASINPTPPAQENSDSFTPEYPPGNNLQARRRPGHAHTRTKSKFDLAKIVNLAAALDRHVIPANEVIAASVEDEAETRILEAIERQKQISKEENVKMNETLIPKEAEHLFTNDNNVKESRQKDESDQSSPKTSPSMKPPSLRNAARRVLQQQRDAQNSPKITFEEPKPLKYENIPLERNKGSVDLMFEGLQVVGSTLNQRQNTLVAEKKVNPSIINGGKEEEDDDKEKKWNEESNLIGWRGSKTATHRRVKNWFLYSVRPRQIWLNFIKFLKIDVLRIIVPLLLLSYILFYWLNNPIVYRASLSWWLIFGVRQIVTLNLARATEYFFIESLVMRSTIVLKSFGAVFTLLLIQSRGWPGRIIAWATWDFILLYGISGPKLEFAEHWLYAQSYFRIFSKENPGGAIVFDPFYRNVLIAGIVVGVATSIKRTWVAYWIGRKTYGFYNKKLRSVQRKAALLSEIADLADDINETAKYENSQQKKGSSADRLSTLVREFEREGESPLDTKPPRMMTSDSIGLPPRPPSSPKPNKPVRSSLLSKYTRGKAQSETSTSIKEEQDDDDDSVRKGRSDTIFTEVDVEGPTPTSLIMDELEQWDQPKTVKDRNVDTPSMQNILEFRQSLSSLNDDYPFSFAFGRASTRELCIESSQEVYNKLLALSPNSREVRLDILGLVALMEDGTIDDENARRLVKMFRADSLGFISQVSFAQTCDNVFKKLRFLHAAVANANRIDRVLESIINGIFFIALAFVVVAILGFDPFAVLLSFSTLVLSFTFAFGSAASKYTEGLLLIAIRRPFDVGDRVAFSSVDRDTDAFGSSTWFVEDLNLVFTTLRYASTNEVCTVSNASIAHLRIINGARSKNANLIIPMKFGIGTPQATIQLFQDAIKAYIVSRPQTWLEYTAFRCSAIEPDLGYVQYKLIASHVKSWQESPKILNDKEELYRYSLEVAKSLQIGFTSPPVPVNVQMLPNVVTHSSGFPSDPLQQKEPPRRYNWK